MNKAVKGQWVEIENEVLSIEERAPQIPEDTKSTPLMMWTRGNLIDSEGIIGNEVSVKTLSDRVAKGKLVDTNPRFAHDFGNPVMELLETARDLAIDLESC